MGYIVEIYLAYGACFLLLGVIALLQPSNPEDLPISRHFPLLGAFGLLHGCRELLDAWKFTLGSNDPALDWFAASLLTVSYLPLFEFGRRAAADHGRANGTVWLPLASLWVYIALGLGLAFFWAAGAGNIAHVEAGARYLLAFPGSVLAGMMLRNAFPARQVATQSLGAAMIVYGISGGLITESVPGFPDWLPTYDRFFEIFGIPVQIVRAACAVVAMLSLSMLVRNEARTVVTRLRESANSYRDLANTLEQRVEERTTALQESERRLQTAMSIADLGYYVWDLTADRCIYCSEEYAAIHGMSVEDYMSTSASLEEDSQFVHPDDHERYMTAIKALRAQGTPIDLEYRIVGKDGRVRNVRELESITEIRDGAPVRTEGTLQDITEMKQAEEKLRQAQKMEVIGQLTGGVAHDFNNILAVILGNLELIEETLPEDDENRDHVEMAIEATARGARLTQRLLAFSRKQALRPEPVDARKLIEGMQDMLRRSLGETIDIELVSDAGLWATEIDPGQLENAILNLSINARDAMPGGGKLTIEASNARLADEYAAAEVGLEPGQYVLISVSDTGEGMSPAIREKVFDPFFTTKETGKGTGLGLSMVHGFVKQSGGHVAIYSEPGEGTTVKLYLPRYRGQESVAARRDISDESALGQGETILVVEDDEKLRTIIVGMLGSLGYRIAETGSAIEALEILKGTVEIDLLLTDVVLPGGTSGRDLAETMRDEGLGQPVLFMSGYTENAVIHHGRLDPGVQLLHKPFHKGELAHAIRRALDSRPA